MKLYTEEQVMEAYHIGTEDSNCGRYRENADALKLTPIELPSDDEIEGACNEELNGLLSKFGFRKGAKWVIEHIKQQDSLNKLPISEWETGVDEQGGYWIEPITNKKWRWKSNEIIKQQDNGTI